MPKLLAAAVVFLTSAAILVLEILAGRLLAPYVGVSLQTYTSAIGTVLAGIALGAWGGGRLADRVPPQRLLGPAVVLGGVLALLTVPIVRSMGADMTSSGGHLATITLTLAAFFLPAVVLSAVTPMVVKMQLHDLEHTGGVVGRLSGISTFGALVGSFLTGFVLVAAFPTKGIILVIGGGLVVGGLALGWWLSRRDRSVVVVLALLAVGVGAIAGSTDQPCDRESEYFCIRVEHDVANASGRILWLDDLQHSYVDLDDPTELRFGYTLAFAGALGVAFPGAEPLDAVHIGGGGFTIPRYLAATRPGTRSVVYEIDPAVVDVGREELGLETSRDLKVHIGDARLAIRDRPTHSADLVVGDAFGGLSVPWHLTTREFVDEVDRVLRDDGLYLVNVIDFSPFTFTRAELKTLKERFPYVAVVASIAQLEGGLSGNNVLVASRTPLDGAAMRAAAEENGDIVLTGAALDRFIGGAPIITDDYAPIDQWLDQARE